MNIEDMVIGTKVYSALDTKILAVISRRVEGWSMYIGPVAGKKHSIEWPGVAATGSKVLEKSAIVIAKEYFGIEISDIEYIR